MTQPERHAPWLDGDVEATAAQLRTEQGSRFGNVHNLALAMIRSLHKTVDLGFLTADEAHRLTVLVFQALDQVLAEPRGGEQS